MNEQKRKKHTRQYLHAWRTQFIENKGVWMNLECSESVQYSFCISSTKTTCAKANASQWGYGYGPTGTWKCLSNNTLQV